MGGLRILKIKNTVLWASICLMACGQKQPKRKGINVQDPPGQEKTIVVAANRTGEYLPLLSNKRVGVVANQTSVIFLDAAEDKNGHVHLVDSLLAHGIAVTKVFAPEHGFRGRADAGAHVNDSFDEKTQLPLLSLHGKNRKPDPGHLKDLDVVLFDIQDVGVRFYTYIATLQLVMEACAEAKVPVVVLDRPNPNDHYVDGPTLRPEHSSFLGMNPIPLVYGMTLGEYAVMINGEGWLANGLKADLTVIPLKNYRHGLRYSLPIRPSPNLPNDRAINLYPSLGLFEGTNINAGRGTEFQFQRYGASFLDSTAYSFSYVPRRNFGSKYPKEEGKVCFGKDLSGHKKMNAVSLQWLIDAYQSAIDKQQFFNASSFTQHAGNRTLQQQLEAGLGEEAIRATWQKDVTAFKSIRKKYLIYP